MKAKETLLYCTKSLFQYLLIIVPKAKAYNNNSNNLTLRDQFFLS